MLGPEPLGYLPLPSIGESEMMVRGRTAGWGAERRDVRALSEHRPEGRDRQ